MLSIHRKNLHFHSFHGLYESEKKNGNQFVVNAHVHYLPPQMPVTELAQTLNYEELFALVSARMAQPTPLLETIAMEICFLILEKFKIVNATFVSIEKTKPPIQGFQGDVVVSFQIDRQMMGGLAAHPR